MDKEYFGIATNLVISFLVTLYGAFAWLPLRTPKHAVIAAVPFRQCSYICWWVSWLCWTLLWFWTGIRHWIGRSDSILLKIPDLVLDNLNSIFLVLVFLIVTRGNEFGKRKILLAFLQVGGSLTAGFSILYALSPWLQLAFSYEIHNAWSLCMSAAGPILVGWAVYLRFNSVLVLVIGFVYGFIQPVAYAFDLQTGTLSAQQILQYQPVVDITLGGLKILWAVVFMQILAHGEAGGNSLVAETNNPGLLGKWDHRTLGHAFLLGTAYILLVVWMLMTFEDHKQIEEFSVAFGIVMGFMGLLDILWRVWGDILKVKPERPGGT